MSTVPRVDYQTEPSPYRHWKLSFNGPVATLAADFDENGGLRPGYKLKLNSYDLGVDIELHDAINRIRFEHPQVRTVVVTSLKDRVFCSGANIFMLGLSSHAWKVNFCKFTNETRNGIEDSSRHCGLKFLAAINGSCAGGGYELALACDEILLVDDRSLVNLQKLTIHAWLDSPSMKMFAPEQNTRSFRLVTTTVRTCGCSKRIRLIASCSSMSTPRS